MMSKYRKRQYVIYDDNDDELVWCSFEKGYRPATDFDLSDKTEHGYKSFCNVCTELHKVKYKDVYQVREAEEQRLKRLMLENIGYDFNSEFTIHEQFLMKHNLLK